METLTIKLDPEKFDPAALAPAAEIMRSGGIVAFPTETVYGLGVNLERPDAVERLLELRHSPNEKHITVHVASIEQAASVAKIPPCGAVRRLMRRFWPGPLTLVFPSEDGRGVGVRYPNNKIACELIRRAGVKIGAPSANLAGDPPATDAAEVARVFSGQIECLIDGGPSQHHASSTVVRIGGKRPEVLREGAIPAALIEEIAVMTVLFICTGNTCRSPIAEHIFRRMLAKRLGVEDDELESAGIHPMSAGTGAGAGSEPFEALVEAMRGMGLDLSGHRSRPATAAMVQEADRVFAMTRRHKEQLGALVPECASHIDLLDPEGRDIEDPFGGDVETYRECAGRIRAALEKRLAEF